MSDLTPRIPKRPLLWPDIVFALQAMLRQKDTPVYIVGGAVRDAYLHRPIHDLDLATPNHAIRLGRQIADALKGDFFVLDRARDIARVLAEVADTGEKVMIDIAHFQGGDLLADLTGRDFTLNAMAVDLQGDLDALIDPLHGEQDLVDRVLRQCNPHAVLNDPIRALRAVRQSLQLKARIEPETLGCIRAAAPRLLESSSERVRDELFKILSSGNPVPPLRVADALGLLAVVIPEIASLHGIAVDAAQEDAWHHTLTVVEKLDGLLAVFDPHRTGDTAAAFGYGMVAVALGHLRPRLREHLIVTWPDDRTHRGVLILAALLHDLRDATGQRSNCLIKERVEALRLSNIEQKRLSLVMGHYTTVFDIEITPLALHRFWYSLGEAGVDVCLFALAKRLAKAGIQIDHAAWVMLVERVQTLLDAYFHHYGEIVAPAPLLDGNQLMDALGLRPGKHIGNLLTLIREGQVTGEITTIDEALATARASLNTLR